jgi:hypothetical protein
MPLTPIYGLRYPALPDPPDGPKLGEELALDVEAELARIDGVIATIADIQIFTANGTWNKPTGARWIHVRVCGSGGGGGGAQATGAGQTSAASGGQAGHYSESLLSAGVTAASVSVTVATGGAGGVGGANGGAGGTSSFGAHVSAGGGAAGAFIATANTLFVVSAGANALSGTGQIQAAGGPGSAGIRFGVAQALGGAGGNNPLGTGGGATGSQNTGSAGQNGTGYGGGGSGACNHVSQAARNGGAGANGVVIVITYF